MPHTPDNLLIVIFLCSHNSSILIRTASPITTTPPLLSSITILSQNNYLKRVDIYFEILYIIITSFELYKIYVPHLEKRSVSNICNHLHRKLLILLIYGVALILWLANDWPCIPRAVFSIPCPCCGLTRAYIALFHLEFRTAFSFHPMFWIIPILILLFLADGDLFRHKRANTLLLIALVGSFGVCYIVRLVAFLNGSFAI